MNLYRISQAENCGCDTYDSAVVAAESPEEAALIHPDDLGTPIAPPAKECEKQGWCSCPSGRVCFGPSWVTDPSKVAVKFLGVACDDVEPGVIVASFNAG